MGGQFGQDANLEAQEETGDDEGEAELDTDGGGSFSHPVSKRAKRAENAQEKFVRMEHAYEDYRRESSRRPSRCIRIGFGKLSQNCPIETHGRLVQGKSNGTSEK